MSREVFVEPCSRQGEYKKKEYTSRIEKIIDIDMKIFSVIFRFVGSLYEKFDTNKKLCLYYLMVSDIATENNKDNIIRLIETFKNYLNQYDFNYENNLHILKYQINDTVTVELDIPLFIKTSKKQSIIAYLKYIKKLIEIKN